MWKVSLLGILHASDSKKENIVGESVYENL